MKSGFENKFVRVQIITLLAIAIIGGSSENAQAIGVVLTDKMYTAAKYTRAKKVQREKVIQSSVVIKNKLVKPSSHSRHGSHPAEKDTKPATM